MSNYTYTKADRLRKRSEFIYVSQFGKKVQNKHFVAYCCQNQRETMRLGVTVTKRIGKAAARNRIKRSIREHFRLNRKQFHSFLDMNIIAKTEAADLTSEEIFLSLKGLFEKIQRECDR